MAITVKPYKGESVESLYVRFKRKCKEEKIFLQIMKNEFYVKPSQRKKNKRRKKQLDNF